MNELKVGLLAIAAMVAVAYMSFKVTSNQSGFGEYVPYRTIMEDASGIFPKTPIKIAGIKAGRITSIELQGNKALIGFEVLKSVKISKGAKIKVRSVGFLGDKYIDIIVAPDEPMLAANSFIVSEIGDGMEELVKNAGDVLKDVKIIVRSLKTSLAPEGEDSPITNILNSTKDMVEDLRTASSDLKEIMSTNKGDLRQIVANIKEITEQIGYQVDAANKDSLVADMKQIKPVLDNVKKVSEDLRDVMERIRRGEGTLGKLLVDETISDEVRETLAGVKKMVNKVDSIQTEMSAFTGINTTGSARTDAGLKIYPSPERFYLLGLSTSEMGVVNENETTTIENGVESVKTTKTRDKDSLLFNIQLGRKYHNWQFRGGLIESSGGVGLDYELKRIQTVLSAELFDYSKDVGPNLRLSSEMFIWNVIYSKIALEDVAYDFNVTVGAGLRFTDEDIKGLLGFFL